MCGSLIQKGGEFSLFCPQLFSSAIAAGLIEIQDLDHIAILACTSGSSVGVISAHFIITDQHILGRSPSSVEHCAYCPDEVILHVFMQSKA